MLANTLSHSNQFLILFVNWIKTSQTAVSFWVENFECGAQWSSEGTGVRPWTGSRQVGAWSQKEYRQTWLQITSLESLLPLSDSQQVQWERKASSLVVWRISKNISTAIYRHGLDQHRQTMDLITRTHGHRQISLGNVSTSCTTVLLSNARWFYCLNSWGRDRQCLSVLKTQWQLCKHRI